MKSVIVHGMLALAGLVAAYQTWARDEAADEPTGEALVFDCAPQALQSLKLESDARRTLLERRQHAGETVFWGSTARKAGDDFKEPREFLMGNAWGDHLKRVAPLRALRALGHVGPSELENFELKSAKTRLELRCGDQTHTLLVGGSTYGRGDRYAQKEGGHEVYVLAADIVGYLEAAEFRFKQKKLHGFQPTDVDGARIQAQGVRVELVHRNHRDAKGAMWVSAAEPDRRNELFDNWLQRVHQLTAVDYLGLDAEPGSDLAGDAGSATPVVSIEYTLQGKSKGKLEIVRVDADGKPNYYGRSEATRAWVTLPRVTAKQVAREAGLVVGLEEIDQGGEGDAVADGDPVLPAGHPSVPAKPGTR